MAENKPWYKTNEHSNKNKPIYSLTNTSQNHSRQVQAQELFAKKGPICATEGYFQHIGECASDSIQMLFSYNDFFKEIVQKALIEKTVEDIVKGTQYENDEDLLTFLQFFQRRFLRHYLNEEEVCEMPNRKYGSLRTKGVNAFATITAIQKSNKNTKMSNYNPGLDTIQTLEIVQKIINVFQIPNISIQLQLDVEEEKKKENKFGATFFYTEFANLAANSTVAIKPTYMMMKKTKIGNKHLYLPEISHTNLFFQCGNQYYFYDNNQGIIPFDWKLLFQSVHDDFKEKKTSLSNPENIVTETTHYPEEIIEHINTLATHDEKVHFILSRFQFSLTLNIYANDDGTKSFYLYPCLRLTNKIFNQTALLTISPISKEFVTFTLVDVNEKVLETAFKTIGFDYTTPQNVYMYKSVSSDEYMIDLQPIFYYISNNYTIFSTTSAKVPNMNVIKRTRGKKFNWVLPNYNKPQSALHIPTEGGKKGRKRKTRKIRK